MARYAGEGVLGHETAGMLHAIVTRAVVEQIWKGGDMSHLRVEQVPVADFGVDTDKLTGSLGDLELYPCLENCALQEVDGVACLTADLTERGVRWSGESR